MSKKPKKAKKPLPRKRLDIPDEMVDAIFDAFERESPGVGRGPDGQAHAIGILLADRIAQRRMEKLAAKEPTRANCPACGKLAPRNCQQERTVQGLAGPIRYSRSVYLCTCGNRFSPLDDELGMKDGSDATAALRNLISFVAAEEPTDVAAETLTVCLGIEITRAMVASAVAVDGAVAERVLDSGAAPARDPVRTVLVEIDGCHAPHRDGWHETKVAVVADAASRIEKPPSPGEIERAKAENRQPEGREILRDKKYVADARSLDDFSRRVWTTAAEYGVERARRVVVVGDGAPWIWNLSRDLFQLPQPSGWGGENTPPELIEVVDWYHAVEHLWNCAELLFRSRESRLAQAWVAQQKDRLWDGKALGIGAALRALAAKHRRRGKALRREAHYFEGNAARMNYPMLREMDLPIGSGPAEGACKTVVQSRCKRAGMRWSREGLNRVLALRQLRLNHEWPSLERAA